MRNLRTAMLAVLVTMVCSMSASALRVSITSCPERPEKNVLMSITITFISGTEAMTHEHFWVDGNVTCEGTTDGRGTRVLYVNVPDAPCLRFTVHTDTDPTGQEFTIPIALGSWETNHILSGSLECAWSIAAGETGMDPGSWPVFSCVANCAGVCKSQELGPGEDGSYHSSKGTISSQTIKTSNLDLALVTSAPESNGFSVGVGGSVTMTDACSFSFKPTKPSGTTPSMAFVYRSGNLALGLQTGAAGQDTRAGCTISAISEFAGAGSLHMSREGTDANKPDPDPINVSRTLLRKTVSSYPVEVTTARSASGSASFTAGSPVIWGSRGGSSCSATASDNVEVRPFSVDMPQNYGNGQ